MSSNTTTALIIIIIIIIVIIIINSNTMNHNNPCPHVKTTPASCSANTMRYTMILPTRTARPHHCIEGETGTIKPAVRPAPAIFAKQKL
jgi:hypothetical protein